MAVQRNFSEYTKLRDIAQKRMKRVAAAGLAPAVHFPTVREIKAGVVDPGQAMRELKAYLSGGSTLTAVRQTGMAPVFKSYPELPKPKPVSAELKKERRREQQKLYRQRRKVREIALTPAKAKKYEGYLKALDTVSKAWKEAGFDLGMDLKSLSPAQAQAYVEYMEYRFSQGDFNQKYVIDEFIQDFSRLLNSGYNPKNIQDDFNLFLENRAKLAGRADVMEGIDSSEFGGLWDEFINKVIG